MRRIPTQRVKGAGKLSKVSGKFATIRHSKYSTGSPTTKINEQFFEWYLFVILLKINSSVDEVLLFSFALSRVYNLIASGRAKRFHDLRSRKRGREIFLARVKLGLKSRPSESMEIIICIGNEKQNHRLSFKIKKKN